MCLFAVDITFSPSFNKKLLSQVFLGQLTVFSLISLKRRFLLFRCYITLFSAFLHGIEVLVFLQVITMILTLSYSKQCFSRFVAKLRCWQVFLHRKRFPLVCGLSHLFQLVLTQMKVFPRLSQKFQCPQLFSHWKRFSAVRT